MRKKNKNNLVKDSIQNSIQEEFDYYSKSKINKIVTHCGGTNSGKTYHAVQDLKKSSSGAYLAPLRLLAWEVYDKLNKDGFPCNLITGEERILVPGAKITASTVEMYNPFNYVECIVLDEAHMIADEQRGWAWTRALLKANCDTLHIIHSPNAENLISSLLTKLNRTFETNRYERLTPLVVASKAYDISNPLEKTIYVAFDRKTVLSLKSEFNSKKIPVSVIYGNLPPEVRRKQTERFISGETKICVATDAIAMGMNLPADRVCFITLEKFDGKKNRKLFPEEIKQIAGRAGRYQISKFGEVSALQQKDLPLISSALAYTKQLETKAKICPELYDLERIDKKSLFEKLVEWERLNPISKDLSSVLSIVDMEPMKELSKLISNEEQKNLGLENCFILIKAPTTKNSVGYWKQCVTALSEKNYIPTTNTINKISSQKDLILAEELIKKKDIYTWIGLRPEFEGFADKLEKQQNQRFELSGLIDSALLKSKFKTGKSCSLCERVLPFNYQFGMCEDCFNF